MHTDSHLSNTTNYAPRFPVAQNVARTMSSAELLEIINAARAEAGEPEIRRNKFAEKIEDELEGEHYTKRVVQNLNRTESAIFDLTRDQCMLVSMRESKAVRRRVVARLNAIDAAAGAAPQQSKLLGEMAILECFTRLLKPAPSSQMMMLSKIAQQNGLDAGFLPGYAVDAAPGATDGSSMPTKALSALLREHHVALSAAAFNQVLKAHGYLKRLTRKNSHGVEVAFWSITDMGLQYGKNLTSPSCPRETQPHWYTDRFAELVKRVGGGL